MSKKRGLGRGLGALIPTESATDTTSAETAGSGLKEVAVADIQPNPQQPRSEFDQEKLAELAASIKEHGLIQPLIVTESTPGQYTLIAGERRWRASKLAQIERVPVVVKEATAQEMLELAIIENVQRADLNALEEALAYRQLMDEFGLTQMEVADRMGKGRSTIANMVRLLELPRPVQEAVLQNQISGRHAREMLRLSDEDDQLAVLRTVVEFEYTVRQTVRLIDKFLARKKSSPKPRREKSPEIKAVQSAFEGALGTKVDVNKGDKGGKIVIHFYDDEDLNKLYDTIVGPQE